jgi:hypothetical protein
LRDAFQFRRAALVFPRSRNITHRFPRDGPVEIRVRVSRIQADGLAAIVDGALVIVHPQSRVSARIERQGMSRIHLQRLIEDLHRFLEILLLRQIAALPVQAIGVPRRMGR